MFKRRNFERDLLLKKNNDMKKIFLLTVIVLGLCSCEHIMNSRPPDFWTIKLLIDAQGCDTTMIISQPNKWDLRSPIIEDEYNYIYFPVCDAVLSYETGLLNPVRSGVCSDSIMTVKYDILSEDRVEIVQFESDYLHFTKETPTRIHLVVKPNLTGKTRRLSMTLAYGDATIIEIIQLSE
jgi:hypothetical protein